MPPQPTKNEFLRTVESGIYANPEVRRTNSIQLPWVKQAQSLEFGQILNILDELREAANRPLRILDIGVGSGRVPGLLIADIARGKTIDEYVGIDIERYEIDEAVNTIGHYAPERLRFVCADARSLETAPVQELESSRFDLILCTYFTAGNFRPHEIHLETLWGRRIGIRTIDIRPDLLETNQSFVQVFRWAGRHLNPGGRIVLGTTYVDNDATRRMQEQFYTACGMTILPNYSQPQHFTATRQGFWSERFTNERLLRYFSAAGFSKKDITVLDLIPDTVRMVIVGSGGPGLPPQVDLRETLATTNPRSTKEAMGTRP